MSMECRNCGGQARETSYGPFCDRCGGVWLRPGEPYVRHVATAKGEGGEFPILYDHSLSEYAFSFQRLVRTWVQVQNDWVQTLRTFTKHGTLDEMIALVQPHARGTGAGIPELLTGSGATPEEILILDELPPMPQTPEPKGP